MLPNTCAIPTFLRNFLQAGFQMAGCRSNLKILQSILLCTKYSVGYQKSGYFRPLHKLGFAGYTIYITGRIPKLSKNRHFLFMSD